MAASSLFRSSVPRATAARCSTSSSSSISPRRAIHRLLPAKLDASQDYWEEQFHHDLAPNGDALRTGKFVRMSVFMPARTVKRVTIDYQQGLLDRLNQQVKQTNLEHSSVVDTMLMAARDPALALTFQYASLALNNSFFVDGLKAPGTRDAFSSEFTTFIERSFGSVAAMQDGLYDAVLGMESSGYVWLVQKINVDPLVDVNRLEWKVTYGAGTLLHSARRQFGHKDGIQDANLPLLPTKRPAGYEGRRKPAEGKEEPVTNTTWEHSPSSSTKPEKVPFSERFEGLDRIPSQASPEPIYVPLACLSMHERCYVDTFGFHGRTDYAARWLMMVDWEKVWSKVVRRKGGRPLWMEDVVAKEQKLAAKREQEEASMA